MQIKRDQDLLHQEKQCKGQLPFNNLVLNLNSISINKFNCSNNNSNNSRLRIKYNSNSSKIYCLDMKVRRWVIYVTVVVATSIKMEKYMRVNGKVISDMVMEYYEMPKERFTMEIGNLISFMVKEDWEINIVKNWLVSLILKTLTIWKTFGVNIAENLEIILFMD